MVIAVIAAFSAAALFLWNELMPEIFGLPALNYWQAAGLLILARILFGGLGPGHFSPRRMAGDERLFAHGNALREKWMNMSEDERERFMRSRRRFFHEHGTFDKQEKSGGNGGNGGSEENAGNSR
jgi:hypothetical protein